MKPCKVVKVDHLPDEVDASKVYSFGLNLDATSADILTDKYVQTVFQIRAALGEAETRLRHEVRTDAEHRGVQTRLAAHLKVLGDTLALVNDALDD